MIFIKKIDYYFIYIIYKMSNKTYEHNNLEFDIVKHDDVVTITCIDKIMRISYQEKFTQEYITDRLLLNNLNNFYNVICHSFDNNTIKIVIFREKIVLSINSEITPVVFQFDISLYFMNGVEMNETTVYIEKLEKRIRELEENTIIPIGYFLKMREHVFSHCIINKLIIHSDRCFDVNLLYGRYGTGYISSSHYDFNTKILTIYIYGDERFAINNLFKTIKTKNIEFSGTLKQLTNEQLLHFPQLIN